MSASAVVGVESQLMLTLWILELPDWTLRRFSLHCLLYSGWGNVVL